MIGSRLFVVVRILEAKQKTAMAPVRRKQSMMDEKAEVLYVSSIAMTKTRESP